jgi:hypothetical protein
MLIERVEKQLRQPLAYRQASPDAALVSSVWPLVGGRFAAINQHAFEPNVPPSDFFNWVQLGGINLLIRHGLTLNYCSSERMNKRHTKIPVNTLNMSQLRIKVIASYTATPCSASRIEQATGG